MKPPALRTRVLRALAGTAVAVLLAATAIYGYDALVSAPVQRVEFSGDTARIPPEALEAFAASIRGSTVRASLGAVREAARRIPWVRNASVRRSFPDAIEVRLETYEPLARWNDAALLSTRGEIFTAAFDAPLPRLRGPDAAAPLMARRYPALAAAVAPLASPIAELRLSPRGAGQLTLASGLDLDLGRADLEERVARFASAWPELAARGIVPAHADLRYANGFALRKEKNPTPKDRQRT